MTRVFDIYSNVLTSDNYDWNNTHEGKRASRFKVYKENTSSDQHSKGNENSLELCLKKKKVQTIVSRFDKF